MDADTFPSAAWFEAMAADAVHRPEVYRQLGTADFRLVVEVVDGDAVALRPDGRPRPFQVTSARVASQVAHGAQAPPTALTAFLFDVLHADGEDLIEAPAADRVAPVAAGVCTSATPQPANMSTPTSRTGLCTGVCSSTASRMTAAARIPMPTRMVRRGPKASVTIPDTGASTVMVAGSANSSSPARTTEDPLAAARLSGTPSRMLAKQNIWATTARELRRNDGSRSSDGARNGRGARLPART